MKKDKRDLEVESLGLLGEPEVENVVVFQEIQHPRLVHKNDFSKQLLIQGFPNKAVGLFVGEDIMAMCVLDKSGNGILRYENPEGKLRYC